jgi:uncharacterized membrane protein
MGNFWARAGLVFFIVGTVGAFTATESTSTFMLIVYSLAQFFGCITFLIAPEYNKKERG